jgi:hypothetical protein
MNLDTRAFALSCALLWGFGILLITWWIVIWDGPSTVPTFLGRMYRGYSLSFVGGLIGMIWGLVDGAVGGLIFAWIYNRLRRPA